MENTRSDRIAGLDLLRASAIVFVLLAHYPKTGSGLATRALNLGWTGVDLFFVLSGYLIAGQLFKAVSRGNDLECGNFYLKRLLRTLPSYYAVLAVYFLLLPAPNWKYLVFAQNFDNPKAFSPSWSLCVEEQFYLVFPLFVWLVRRFRTLVWWIPAMLAAEFAIRSVVWLHVRPDLLPEPQALETYMTYLYYPTSCRLDGIILGVGIAALKWFHPVLWRQLMMRGSQLVLASGGFLATAILAFWKHYSFWCSTVGFTLLNLGFALLTLAALSPTGFLGQLRVWGAKEVALLSYSIYLTHTLVLEFTGRVFGSLTTLAAGSSTIVLILVAAIILYICVERPALALRRRVLEKYEPHPYPELVNAGPVSSH